MRITLTLAMLMALAACAHDHAPVEVRYKTITTVKRGPCPDAASYAKIKAGKPTPLRSQAKPRTGTERVARQSAQLGLYEAEGGWADKAMAALDRCQVAGEDREEGEGLANSP